MLCETCLREICNCLRVLRLDYLSWNSVRKVNKNVSIYKQLNVKKFPRTNAFHLVPDCICNVFGSCSAVYLLFLIQ